jgi:hypothetical protein
MGRRLSDVPLPAPLIEYTVDKGAGDERDPKCRYLKYERWILFRTPPLCIAM